MKKIRLLAIMLAGLILVQCSKKGDGDSKPDLTKGLLAYFPLDNKIYDSAKSLEVGSLGIISYKKDRKGVDKSAAEFDSSFISFKCYGWAANPLSISLWVAGENVTYNGYFMHSEQGIFGMSQSCVLSTSMSYGMTVTTINTNTAMAPAEFGWMHVVGTYDGKDIKTYINGELKSTMHHPGQTGGTNRVFMGNRSKVQWRGILDDIRFYNRILTDEEILLLSKQ